MERNARDVVIKLTGLPASAEERITEELQAIGLSAAQNKGDGDAALVFSGHQELGTIFTALRHAGVRDFSGEGPEEQNSDHLIC